MVTDLKGILKLGISSLFQSAHTSFSPGIPPSFSIPSMLAPTSHQPVNLDLSRNMYADPTNLGWSQMRPIFMGPLFYRRNGNGFSSSFLFSLSTNYLATKRPRRGEREICQNWFFRFSKKMETATSVHPIYERNRQLYFFGKLLFVEI